MTTGALLDDGPEGFRAPVPPGTRPDPASCDPLERRPRPGPVTRRTRVRAVIGPGGREFPDRSRGPVNGVARRPRVRLGGPAKNAIR
ncbi:hypothetical protein J2853_004405 [Streptosporangium lutulentum]|uniref:Uncharacterized protein n=1 Tax=Streptosporangium lutulentum TaxID=1461250 RepID=A0ABT9QGM7_9ACTN|nr:hypothetical protein [Streptosporangium lutulentum]